MFGPRSSRSSRIFIGGEQDKEERWNGSAVRLALIRYCIGVTALFDEAEPMPEPERLTPPHEVDQTADIESPMLFPSMAAVPCVDSVKGGSGSCCARHRR